MSRHSTALPSAAVPSLSMATSAMDMSLMPVPGFVLTVAGSLVWGAKMAPIEKLRDERNTGLGWPQLNDDTQQPTK
jgi:hypothetical protein